MLHSVGVATQEDEIAVLERQERAWMEHAAGQAPLVGSERDQWADEFVGGLRNDQVCLIGPQLVFGTRFDAMGYGALQEPMLRHMVLARLAFHGVGRNVYNKFVAGNGAARFVRRHLVGGFTFRRVASPKAEE